jgi:hypothetical protein
LLKKPDGLDKDDPTETVLQLSENPSKVHKFDDEDEPFDIFATGISNLDVANAITTAMETRVPVCLYTVRTRGDERFYGGPVEEVIKAYVPGSNQNFNPGANS